MHPQKRGSVFNILPVNIPVKRAAEVVLRSGAADRWELRVAIKVKLYLSFAPPAGVVHSPSQCGTDVESLALAYDTALVYFIKASVSVSCLLIHFRNPIRGI